MMAVIDSHLNCPRDGKRMVLEVGQDDSSGDGAMRATHICLACDYREQDRDWSRPLRTDPVARIEWLKRKRLEGWTVPIADPLPLGEWLECPTCPYKVWRNGDEPEGPKVRDLAEHVRTHGLDPVTALW